MGDCRYLFVVGDPGRCGTKSLITMIRMGGQIGVLALHEPKPHLDPFMGPNETEAPAIKWRQNISEVLPLVGVPAPTYVEAAHWNTLIIPWLMDTFSGSQFLVLRRRDPLAWAISAYRKGWYLPIRERLTPEEASCRLQPKAGWPVGVDRWYKLGYLYGWYQNMVDYYRNFRFSTTLHTEDLGDPVEVARVLNPLGLEATTAPIHLNQGRETHVLVDELANPPRPLSRLVGEARQVPFSREALRGHRVDLTVKSHVSPDQQQIDSFHRGQSIALTSPFGSAERQIIR